MQKFVDLLDAVADLAGSDRKAAVMIGISQGSVSQWRRGIAVPDDDQAAKIAAQLGLDPAYVFAIVRAARAKSHTHRATWQRIAQQFGKAASIAAFTVGIAGAPTPAPAQGNSGGNAPALCIMSTRRRRPGNLPAFAALALQTLCGNAHRPA